MTGRPNRLDSANRVTTAIRFGPDLHERLRLAADERDVSMNFLVVRAVADFLDRLIPPDEIQWTRPNGHRQPQPSDGPDYHADRQAWQP